MIKTEDQRPKTNENEVAAIILAAGRSERMGAFKPLLPFGANTVIEATIDYLRAGGIDTVIVVLGQDTGAEELKRKLRNARVIFATNLDPASEMAASIACGVRKIPSSAKAVIITPADHPAVPAQVVLRLIYQWGKGAKLVMPTYADRGGHPVLIDLSFRSELLNLDANRGLRSFFQVHQKDLCRVAVGSNYIARDMDTWDDYRALHYEVFGVPPPE